MMSHTRLIKKYPNRRLYDLETSSYVTLLDLRKMILDGMNIQVMDSKTEEDITHLILMQILTASETNGEAIFSTQLLQQLIRLYYQTTPEIFRHFFETNLKMLMDSLQNTGSSTHWFSVWPSLQKEWMQHMQQFLSPKK